MEFLTKIEGINVCSVYQNYEICEYLLIRYFTFQTCCDMIFINIYKNQNMRRSYENSRISMVYHFI